MKILNKKIASKKSSAAWIQRQAADPYVARAHRDGYRARAAYKLIEINEKYKFLKNGQVVVDLGAAPGSWSQYVMRAFPRSRVFAMDLLEITPIPEVEFYQGDFTSDAALDWLVQKLNLPTDGATHGTVDVVLSMVQRMGLWMLCCLIWRQIQLDIKKPIIFGKWCYWNMRLILRVVR